MRVLTIISHTEHYKDDDGTILGLGSTVTEINHLLEIFDHIYHVAMLHDCEAPSSALPYISNRISFVAIPALGGDTMRDKMNLIFKGPLVLKTVQSALRKADYFQFRAPTGIGVYVIPYLIGLSSKPGWFKYAGNWKQKQAPMAYRFQRWLLKKQKRKVTINGRWSDQPLHCLTFENPCLTAAEIEIGKIVIQTKRLEQGQLSLCFVGRLEEAKGVGFLIRALSQLEASDKAKIKNIHIVGDGQLMQVYKDESQSIGLNFIFHGFLARHEVHEIYKTSHAIILPSASEGFPKVIAEAMNYGCLPIVSNVSSLSQYVKHNENGFLLNAIRESEITKALAKVLYLSDGTYVAMIQNANEQHQKFTYAHYNQRIKNEILTDSSKI
ncbi:Glycosyltransferase involved in cell wall bisynthesis [Formosa sp. Hel1_31_208]|uniref:glycosyltransferase n=1 Tax=Formosa sp. Hel1_31_208 TaxID=1798225 RepID=UPI00087D2CD5|nr:glycosyltransferase [Formosa sp. Hel1_31_208]SDS68387.1 Glycosyltransferase involved in cell wall bisynthesis [Formosa sp. Hel1_31_208]